MFFYGETQSSVRCFLVVLSSMLVLCFVWLGWTSPVVLLHARLRPLRGGVIGVFHSVATVRRFLVRVSSDENTHDSYRTSTIILFNTVFTTVVVVLVVAVGRDNRMIKRITLEESCSQNCC